MRLLLIWSLLSTLCLWACERRSDVGAEASERALVRVDTLLHRAKDYAPELLMDSLATLSPALVDSFYRKQLARCYQLLDTACIASAVRQYATLKPNDPGTAATIDFFRALTHQWAARYDTAEVYYARATDWFEQSTDTAFLCGILNARSGNFAIKGQIDKDIEMKYRVMKLAEKDSALLMMTRSMLGNSLNKKGDFDKAIALMPPAALQYFAAEQDTIGWAYALVVRGNAHFGQQQWPEALDYMGQALALRRQAAPRMPQSMLCEAYYLYGRCLVALERHQEALDTLRVAELISADMPNRQGLTILHASLGEALFHLGRLGEADAYLEQGLSVSQARGQWPSALSAAQLLYQSKKAQGQIALALEFHEQYAMLRDTVSGREKARLAEELTVKYETREKEQQIAALKAQNRLEAQRNAWVVGSLLLLLGGLWGWGQVRAKRQRERLSYEQKLGEARAEALSQQIALQEAEISAQRTRLEDYAQMLIERNARLGDAARGSGYTDEAQPADDANAGLQRHNILTEDEWGKFRRYFDGVYPGFEMDFRAKFPSSSSAELRLVMLAKMGMNIKESAAMLGISADSVKKARYRLKKKFALSGDQLADMM